MDAAARADNFETSLAELIDFVNENNRLPTPADTHLYTWVRRMRRRFRTGLLAPARITALQAVSFWTWEPMTRPVNFARLVDGRMQPRRMDMTIGQWMNEMRRRYFAGDLSLEQIQDMEAVPGWRWVEA